MRAPEECARREVVCAGGVPVSSQTREKNKNVWTVDFEMSAVE